MPVEVLNQTLENIKKMLPMYVFADRNRALPINRDTKNDINSLQSRLLNGELSTFEFEEEITQIFASLYGNLIFLTK